MKKTAKIENLFSNKVTFTTSDKLNNLKPSKLSLEKLEKANKILRGLKSPLPR